MRVLITTALLMLILSIVAAANPLTRYNRGNLNDREVPYGPATTSKPHPSKKPHPTAPYKGY
jgi:hypothetical protein